MIWLGIALTWVGALVVCSFGELAASAGKISIRTAMMLAVIGGFFSGVGGVVLGMRI